MNLRDLEYLIAIDELKHFRKAAQKCCVSQPTLSGQLKKLEDSLGVQLVERSQRTVILTEIGHEVVKRARVIHSEIQGIEELAATYTNPMSGSIRVGLTPTLAPYLLPVILEPIKQNYPVLELLLHEAQTNTLLQKLEECTLDVIIISVPVEQRNFDENFLFEEPFFLAVPVNHPLASKDTVTLMDFMNESLLLLEDGHCLRGQALEVCFMASAKEQENFRATSLETIRQMVSVGGGITLMPKLAVPQNVASEMNRIKYIPFQAPSPSRQIAMLFRKNSSRKFCFQELGKLIQSVVEI